MERRAWDGLQQQARMKKALDLSVHFRVIGTDDDSLFSLTRDGCARDGLLNSQAASRAQWRPDELSAAVRDVFHAAVQLGPIAPGQLGQMLDWGTQAGAYQFTPAGLAFFERGEVSLSSPGLLAERVGEVVAENSLNPGVVPLVSEAQRCWAMRCHRAAMVLIGLSAEDACTGLLDALVSYPSPPTRGTQAHTSWSQAIDGSRSFYARWQPGLYFLGEVRSALRKAYSAQRPDWWRVWEPVPGGIGPFGEAVRLGRNVAAHSVGDVFTPAQVGLLLASLPAMLEVIGQLTRFVQKPPSGVVLPTP